MMNLLLGGLFIILQVVSLQAAHYHQKVWLCVNFADMLVINLECIE